MRIGLLLSMGMLVASGVQAQELGAIPGESGFSGSVLAGAALARPSPILPRGMQVASVLTLWGLRRSSATLIR